MPSSTKIAVVLLRLGEDDADHAAVTAGDPAGITRTISIRHIVVDLRGVRDG